MFSGLIRWVQMLTVIGVFAIAFISGGCANEGPTTPPPDGDNDTLPRFHATDGSPAWSPDGSKIAFLSCELDPDINWGGSCSFVVQNIESGQRDTLLTAGGFLVSSIDWSPEGTALVLATIDGMQILEIGSDSLHTIIAGEYINSASWSKVSGEIFFLADGVHSILPDGSNLRRLTMRRQAIFNPWVFDDSDTLVCFSWYPNPYCIGLLPVGDTAFSDTLLCGWPEENRVIMSPNHRTLVFNGRGSKPGRFTLCTLDRQSGTIDTIVASQVYDFDISPDGNWVVYQDGQETGGLRMINLMTREVRQLTRGE